MDMNQCIQDCIRCHQVCIETINHCLQKGGKHAAAEHIRTLADCAEICQTSANFMLRNSELHNCILEPVAFVQKSAKPAQAVAMHSLTTRN